MPGNNVNGANPPSEAPQSLRDIAEAAYDQLESGADQGLDSAQDEGPGPESLDQGGQPRDTSGRWVAKNRELQPGEAIEGQRPDPAPKPEIQPNAATQPDPAGQAPRSNQAPEHWGAEDKATFAKLPQEAQSFLLRRHGEMEAEFTKRAQVSAGAVNFAQALTPVFTDPTIMGSLQQQGLNPVQAIHQWAGFHQRALSPRQEDRFGLLIELTERMGLDPARIFTALSQPQVPSGLDPAALQDPALRFFADHIGRTTNDLQALRNELQQVRQAETQAREQAALESTRWSIDQYADEKGPNGQPVRPYFDAVLPIIIDMYKANPQRDMNEVYDAACWAHPEVRAKMLAAERGQQQNAQAVERAKLAQRGNTRGLTTPVSRPPGNGPSQGTLRDTIERSAEELGY